MLDHDQVWAAIDNLASRHGLSPSALARRAGLDPTTFNKSKRHAADGRPRWPSTESIAKILRATDSSIVDLFSGARTEPTSTGPTAVPLLGTAHAGCEGALAKVAVAPSPARIVSFPDAKYEPLYALTVTGNSMVPVYRDGDMVFVAPSVEPQPGDRVIVKLKGGDVLVKMLLARDETAYTFHATSPEHPDAVLAAASIEWIAKIVYASQ